MAPRWVAVAAVLVAMAATSVVWLACSVATIRAAGGRVSQIVLGWLGVASWRLGRTHVTLGLLPISASVAPMFPPVDAAPARPDGDLPEERSLEALPFASRLGILLVPWMAVLAVLAAAGGRGALASFARGTWQVLVPVGPGGQRLAGALVATAASGLPLAVAAVVPKILAASVDVALAMELLRPIAPRALPAVFVGWLALAAAWAWAIAGAGA